MIHILLVDDQNLVQQGIKSLLDQDMEFNVIGTVKDGRTAIDQIALLRPDIVLLDIEMPGMNGITATKYINRLSPKTKVIILSSYEDKKYVMQALMAGARGYILKSSMMRDLKQAILAVNNGYSQIESRLLAKVFNPNSIKFRRGKPSAKTKKLNNQTKDREQSLVNQQSQSITQNRTKSPPNQTSNKAKLESNKFRETPNSSKISSPTNSMLEQKAPQVMDVSDSVLSAQETPQVIDVSDSVLLEQETLQADVSDSVLSAQETLQADVSDSVLLEQKTLQVDVSDSVLLEQETLQADVLDSVLLEQKTLQAKMSNYDATNTNNQRRSLSVVNRAAFAPIFERPPLPEYIHSKQNRSKSKAKISVVKNYFQQLANVPKLSQCKSKISQYKPKINQLKSRLSQYKAKVLLLVSQWNKKGWLSNIGLMILGAIIVLILHSL